ncbi:hypothetical protein Tco_1301625 [Tanacetum coccineum]
MKLSSSEYGNQFLNDNADMSLNEVLKDLVEYEVQSMVDVPIYEENLVVQETPLQYEEKVDDEAVLKRLMKLEKKVATMSKIDHTEAIKESVQANVINEVKNQLLKFLSKVVFEYIQPRMERTVRDVLTKNPINLCQSSSASADSLIEYELKQKLYDMMKKIRSFLAHEKHLELFNALMNPMGVDEAIAKGDLDRTPKLKKRHHDDQDPPIDSGKEKKKKRRKDTDTFKSQKDKTPAKSSKEDKAPSEPSKIDKTMNFEESVQDAEIDVEESIKDDVVDAQEPTQDDDVPEVDKSKWFKQVAVERP